MKIKFEITNVPKGEQEKYPTAYLEGTLTISVNNVIFFNHPEILLIEFAIFIERWLNTIKKGQYIDFTYVSMDNDAPILSINCIKNNHYSIYSIWQETEVSELLTKENIIVVFEKYLDNLDRELKLKTGIELNNILKVSRL